MGTDVESFTVERHLGEEMGSITVARRIARDALNAWDYRGHREDVLLVVSELVTNALVHGAGAPVLRLAGGPAQIRIEVHDAGKEWPKAREPGPADGWGLHVIQQLCTRWGTSHREAGKAVWCELAAPLAALAPDLSGSRV
ncbi:ATP-binding protein [Nonomuraea sp. LPB2021202275-12-8]|uniref:ATP-binding protein n=1 Tax=Nonomuraea sp. LPB2021202275-12-8 TaxID=3120159 RepID=UPI00300C17C4